MSILQAKQRFVIDTATNIFLERGIACVSVHDIAQAVGVGEATIYRYFSKKQNLVVAVAVQLGAKVLAYFDIEGGDNGWDKLALFYGAYLRVYREHPEYFRFLSEFDTLARTDGDLAEYEQALQPYYSLFAAAYNEGRADGTVRELDLPLYYMTTTHAILGLCKKLAVEGDLLQQDIYDIEEIQLLIDIILHHIRT